MAPHSQLPCRTRHRRPRPRRHHHCAFRQPRIIKFPLPNHFLPFSSRTPVNTVQTLYKTTVFMNMVFRNQNRRHHRRLLNADPSRPRWSRYRSGGHGWSKTGPGLFTRVRRGLTCARIRKCAPICCVRIRANVAFSVL